MYLIDGNNVMGQYVGWHRDKPASRRRLLEDLARFIDVKKVRLTVVFDGAPDNTFPDGSSFRSIKIFYSRQGSDADTRIIEMVESERNRKNLTVVTSDRSLAARVAVNGVKVMRAGQFRQMVDQISASTKVEPQPDLQDGELNKWLRYFGVSKEDEL